jgi:hypothetical protein
MYQHHIQLTTSDRLTAEEAVKWFQTVKEYGPESIVFTFTVNGVDVAMEYGTYEEREMPHAYIVPLKRDLTDDEARFIVEAWNYMFDRDFDIEISNTFDYTNFKDVELDIEEDLREQALYDMQKYAHNRWYESKISEGWQWGSHFNTRNKTHPALRDWDSLPESHRRAPSYTNNDILEWLQKNKII